MMNICIKLQRLRSKLQKDKNKRCDQLFLVQISKGLQLLQFWRFFYSFLLRFRLLCYKIVIQVKISSKVNQHKPRRSMKNTEKANKSLELHQPSKDRAQEDNLCFQSLLYPNKRVHCNDCRRDISKSSRVLANQLDYCVSCFTNLDDYPRYYHALNKLDFPLFDPKWSAEDELLLFQGLEKHGFGNWTEIAEFISNGKSPQEIQAHYLDTYLQSPNFLPRGELLTRRDSQGRLLKPFKDQVTKKSGKHHSKNNNTNNTPSHQKGSITINSLATQVKPPNPTQIVGFMPKRGDFQVQYDNDAELLLAELQFNEDDTAEEREMKFRIIDIYNQKLTERIRRKQFVLGRNLLDLKEQTRLQKNRTKQEKEMHNMMKVFARFSTVQDHQKLIQGVLKQKELRKKIQELKQLKAKGYRNISEVEADEKKNPKNKEKNDNSGKVNSSKQAENKKLKREVMKQKETSKQDIINKEEEALCNKLKLAPKTYLIIRETIIRQSARKGSIEKEQAFRMFKIERTVIEAVFEFLLAKNEINID